MKARGLGAMYKRGTMVWVRLSVGGRAIRLSTGVRVGPDGKIPKAAKEFYVRKLSELGRGELREGKEPRFEDLREALTTRYKAEQRDDSVKNAERAFHHLSRKFAGWPVSSMTEEAILSWAVSMRDEGKFAVASINLWLKLLRRAFTLLKKRIPNRAEVRQLPGANKRRGTVPDDTLRDIMARMPGHYAAMAWFLRLTGWRSCEAPRIEWRHVDWQAGTVRLEMSKNGRPRERAFDVHLEALLKGLKANREAAGLLTPYVFCMPRGDRIKVENFRSAWTHACRSVGYKGGVHNLRRTRVREQDAIQGIPMTVGMSLVGIDTPAIYRDYASVSVSEQARWLKEAPPVAGGDVVVKFGRTKESA
jgi:integrase